MKFTLDPVVLIQSLGYVGLFSIVFAESGLFFGFFLPGDSLLFSAGLLASQDILDIYLLLIILPIAAITGDNVGYWFGAKVGPAIFTREDSLFFHKKHVERTHQFYEKYGAKAIILARFVPIVRTFTPILAGVGTMEYGKFLRFNMIGGFLWSWGMTLLGYFLGSLFPEVKHYLLPISITIIIISVLPIAFEFYKNRKP
jgi:membrane-associated protein